ncbi:MAG: dephospho-CoA kinase [Reinekea sp.]
MIVGLTGGIGSGKSSAADVFKDLGIDVVNADQIAREVVKPGTEALLTIRRHFGDQVLSGDELDRARLREIIFQSPSEKAWLESLLHPIIRKEMLARLAVTTSPYAILEAPLLFENNLEEFCHRTILIDVSVPVQIKRTATRDNTSDEKVKAIIQSQMPREEKLRKADYIVNNEEDRDALKAQVLRLDQILRLMAANSEFL